MSRISEPDFEKGTLNAYTIRGDEVKPGDQFGYKIVLVVDKYTKTYRAYRGGTGWTDERVGCEGDSIMYEEVKLLFPTVAFALDNQGYVYTT